MTAILVTGGTGTLGRVLVPELHAAGHTVRTLSRRPPPQPAEPGAWAVGDLRHGAGPGQAVAGMQMIVHCATAPRGDERAARHLAGAARTAGVRHVVFISIVGVDRVAPGLLPGEAGDRAGDHRFRAGMDDLAFHSVPRADPARLRAAGPPAGDAGPGWGQLPAGRHPGGGRPAGRAGCRAASRRVANIGGPKIGGPAGLAARYLHTAGQHRPILPVRLPGRVFAAYRAGGHLTPGQAAGTITFEEFLATRYRAGEAR